MHLLLHLLVHAVFAQPIMDAVPARWSGDLGLGVGTSFEHGSAIGRAIVEVKRGGPRFALGGRACLDLGGWGPAAYGGESVAVIAETWRDTRRTRGFGVLGVGVMHYLAWEADIMLFVGGSREERGVLLDVLPGFGVDFPSVRLAFRQDLLVGRVHGVSRTVEAGGIWGSPPPVVHEKHWTQWAMPIGPSMVELTAHFGGRTRRR